MTTTETATYRKSATGGAGSASGLFYALGVVGAWFYFWPLADGFWEHVYSLLQGVFWPAYLVFSLFEFLR